MDSNTPDHFFRTAVKVLLRALALMLLAMMALLLQTPLGAVWSRILDALFGFNSVQGLWYVTRAAGLVAYLLLWLSTVWGLAVSNKIFDPVLQRAFTYDAHQFLSLFAIGFVILHVAVLLGDRYLPYSVAQILIPFASPYRPVWVGIGVIGLYLTLLVSITFYVRRQIGIRTFRVIHYLSFAAFAAAALHGWFSGADTPLVATRLMYAGTALSVVFLTVYLIVITRLNRSNFNRERPGADASGTAEDALSQRAFL